MAQSSTNGLVGRAVVAPELKWWSTEPKVLSIQSHVVHGCVGNRAATFPMELHGVVVNPLNVVNFSNHTGYKVFKGSRTSVVEFEDLVQGLKENGFLDYYYSAILSGYVGKVDVLTAVGTTVKDFLSPQDPRTDNALPTDGSNEGENLIPLPPPTPRSKRLYICDPVCGDNGKLYVPQEVVPIYRDILVPLASIVTPNGFEAALISGVGYPPKLSTGTTTAAAEGEAATTLPSIDTVELAQEAANWFHASPRNVPRVVIKSFEEPAKYPGMILALVSEREGVDEKSTQPKQYLIQVKRIPLGYVSGTGDVFAGLLLGHMTSMLRKGLESANKVDPGEVSKSIFVRSVEYAMSSTIRILQRTKSDALPPYARRANGDVVKELPLVGSQDLVLDQSTLCVEAVPL